MCFRKWVLVLAMQSCLPRRRGNSCPKTELVGRDRGMCLVGMRLAADTCPAAGARRVGRRTRAAAAWLVGLRGRQDRLAQRKQFASPGSDGESGRRHQQTE